GASAHARPHPAPCPAVRQRPPPALLRHHRRLGRRPRRGDGRLEHRPPRPGHPGGPRRRGAGTQGPRGGRIPGGDPGVQSRLPSRAQGNDRRGLHPLAGQAGGLHLLRRPFPRAVRGGAAAAGVRQPARGAAARRRQLRPRARPVRRRRHAAGRAPRAQGDAPGPVAPALVGRRAAPGPPPDSLRRRRLNGPRRSPMDAPAQPTPSRRSWLFRWFERRIDPFPPAPVVQPPRSLYAFCRHYTRGTEPSLALMAVLTTAIAVTEVSLYAFTGSIVDRLSSHTPATFLAEEGWK